MNIELNSKGYIYEVHYVLKPSGGLSYAKICADGDTSNYLVTKVPIPVGFKSIDVATIIQRALERRYRMSQQAILILSIMRCEGIVHTRMSVSLLKLYEISQVSIVTSTLEV